MSDTPLKHRSFWVDHTVRTISCWIFLFILILFALFHYFRMYHSKANINNSSKGKICKFLSIKRLSWIIIICSGLVISNEIIIYTPTQFRWMISDPKKWMNLQSCKLTVFIGFVCIATCKLALYVFFFFSFFILVHNNQYEQGKSCIITKHVSDIFSLQ